jgi:hypothetical protein
MSDVSRPGYRAGRAIVEKAQSARDVLWSGRRLVWTDDMEVPDDGPLHEELTADGLALLIRPDSRRGLTPDHMDQVEAFCRAAVGG